MTVTVNDSHRIHRQDYHSCFTTLPNHIIEDENLTAGAKWILIYLLSRPTDWVVYRSQLSKVYQGDKKGNGKYAVDGWFEELIEQGYIIYTPQDPETGKFIHRYDVYPDPQEKLKERLPKRVKPEMDLTKNGKNHPQQKNNSLQRNEENKLFVVPGLDAQSRSKESVDFKTESKGIDVKDKDSEGTGDRCPKNAIRTHTIKNLGKMQDESVTFSDFAVWALKQGKTWSTDELNQAWEELANYTGVVYNWFGFLEGTIKNIQKKKLSEKIGRKGESRNKRKEECNKTSTKSQLADLPDPTSPSLADLLAQDPPKWFTNG